MIKKILVLLFVVVILIVSYFLLWPVPVEPQAWQPPPNPGYSGPYAQNQRLKAIETLSIGSAHGPEDIALDDQGRIYAATHEGYIVRLEADGSKPQNWADTGGRPLGIDFDYQGNLIVADAYKGLLAISPDAKVSLLADTADGLPILYADDVDVARDGKIYFSDASTRFGAKDWGIGASLFEMVEHGNSGRLLVYDPGTKKASTVAKGFCFSNGVAVSEDQQFVLVNDTGEYKVVRVWIDGPKKGKTETFIDALPGFPDNISTGMGGRFWVALVSPRGSLVDNLAGKPFVRKILLRLPTFMRPKAVPYGHIIAIDMNGKVVEDLQDPDGTYPVNTSVTESKDYLYIGSLVAPVMGRVPKAKVGLN